MLTRSTHISLLMQLRDGVDPVAWREFAHRYGDLIRAVALRRGLQPADCDDVLQDVMLALTRAMPAFEYDPERGSFRGYLKTITSRVISRRLRQAGPSPRLSQDEADNTAPPHRHDVADCGKDAALEALWDAEWKQYHLRLAMQTVESEFNESDRLAFQHYAVEGHDAQSTATTLDLSVDQVYQAKSRILKRLCQLIEQQVQEEG